MKLFAFVNNSVYECMSVILEQDKSSDIEQQPPFGDRKIVLTARSLSNYSYINNIDHNYTEIDKTDNVWSDPSTGGYDDTYVLDACMQ